MDLSEWVYGLFNVTEGIVWIGVAVFLVLNRAQFNPDKRFWVLLAAPAFFAFAISEFMEAPQFGMKMSTEIWTLKLTSGFTVFLCRICYLDPRQKTAIYKTTFLGLTLLSVAVCLNLFP